MRKKTKTTVMASQQSSKDGDLQLGTKDEDAKTKGEAKTDITDGYDMLEDEFVQDMLQGHDHTITDGYVDSPWSPPPEAVEANKRNKGEKKKKRMGFWKSRRNKNKKDDDDDEEEGKDVGKVDDGYMDIAKDFVFRLLDISGISGKLTGPTER
ncbi:hypothetical protein PpBr36_07548 [Pyricularia pennisetigena]|uniref:hypothetical protein n=1 Tax=Pyricularia pennisetigena TaxID=1578925 RepID=UPI001152A417|nr:hypothetical protein PpBr36_07548 [Pyricularia pennisetigena]TLS25503.1 hypothetical protein PpBr36_07548 [Pyricularia pennisetigena]